MSIIETASQGRPVGHAGPAETCIIMNDSAGRKGADGQAAAVRAFVEARGDRIALREFEDGSELPDLCQQALDDGFQTIIAAGGDGTVGAIAACVSGTDRRMGILPLGTFNYFARSLGIPTEIDAALAVLDGGEVRKVTAGEVNGALFLNNASLGVYPEILREREDTYRRWGRSRLAAYWSVLRTVLGFRRSRRLKVTVDGETRRIQTPLVFVAMSAYQLEEFGLEGADEVRQGKFAVFVAPDTGRLGLLKFAFLLAIRGMRRGVDFELLHGTEVIIEPTDKRDRDRLIARDGEKERMTPPLKFRVLAETLTVLVPVPEAVEGVAA